MNKIKLILASALLMANLSGGFMSVFAADANLVANASVETTSGTNPANWTSNAWGTNTPTFTYMTTGHTGNRSLYVSLASRTDGDAKWIPDASTVSASTSYTYSSWYKSSVATEIDAQITDKSGNVTYQYLASVPASSDWKQTSTTFTTPSTAAKISVLQIIASAGWLQTDDFSLAPTVVATPTAGSLILNGSFETDNGGQPANWTQDNWGTNTSTFSYDTAGHTGSHAATVTMSTYTDGDAKWAADPVAVTAGKQYTYNDYYKSGVATPVIAAFIDASGNYTYSDLATAPAASAWTAYSATFTAPASAKQVVVYHLISSVGSLSIDDVTLAPATVVPTSNLLANPSAETASGTNPASWTASSWGTNTTAFTYAATGAHTGSRALTITTSKYTDGDAKWVPTPVAVTSDTQYTFSDYYKSTVQTEVVAAFDMPDGTQQYETIGIPDASASYTQFSTTFTVPNGAKDMSVYHLIQSVGTLTIDDANLSVFTPAAYTRGLVTLTFDDGYDSNYSNVMPLLKASNMSASFYIVTGLLGTSGYMTNAQVKALSTAGYEIGSHTITHNAMNAESAATYDKELSQSQTTLQMLTGKKVTTFAYPEGLYTKAVQTDAAKYYSAQRGVEVGLNAKNNLNVQDIKVQNIDQTTTTVQLQDWLKQAAATKTWLVLVYHSVYNDTTHGQYNVTPATLKTQLAAVKSSGLTVETMTTALAEVQAQK